MAKTTKEIRELSVAELQKRLQDLKQETFNLRLQQATGQLENSTRIRTIRREIARITTFITERSKG